MFLVAKCSGELCLESFFVSLFGGWVVNDGFESSDEVNNSSITCVKVEAAFESMDLCCG